MNILWTVHLDNYFIINEVIKNILYAPIRQTKWQIKYFTILIATKGTLLHIIIKLSCDSILSNGMSTFSCTKGRCTTSIVVCEKVLLQSLIISDVVCHAFCAYGSQGKYNIWVYTSADLLYKLTTSFRYSKGTTIISLFICEASFFHTLHYKHMEI